MTLPKTLSFKDLMTVNYVPGQDPLISRNAKKRKAAETETSGPSESVEEAAPPSIGDYQLVRTKEKVSTAAHPDGKHVHEIHHGGKKIGSVVPYHASVDKKKPGSRIVTSRKASTKYQVKFDQGHGPESYKIEMYHKMGHATPTSAFESGVKVHSGWKSQNESVSVDEGFTTSDLSTWKANAEKRGLVVRSAVHPETGESDKYHTAKDKQGNHRGHFEVGKGGKLQEAEHPYHAQMRQSHAMQDLYHAKPNSVLKIDPKTGKRVWAATGKPFDEHEPSIKEADESMYVKAARDEKRKAGPGEYHVTDHEGNKTHKEPFKTSTAAIRHADQRETKTGRVHTVHHVKDGKIQKQWQYSDSHRGFASYGDNRGSAPSFKESVEVTEAAAHPVDAHIAAFSKGIKSSAAKHSTNNNDGSKIKTMKHVEVDASHQQVFDHLRKMGFKKTSGYDPKPDTWTSSRNSDSMTTKTDAVHRRHAGGGVSAHIEHEHGGKAKVHFNAWPDVKEEVEVSEVSSSLAKSYHMKAFMDKSGKSAVIDRAAHTGANVDDTKHKVAMRNRGMRAAEKIIAKEEVEVSETVLNSQQRRAKSILMRRLQPKIKLGRDRASRRFADMDRLKSRAKKAARTVIFRKLTKGIPKDELTFARRAEIEKRLDTPAMKTRIERIAMKMLPKERQMEVDRHKQPSATEK